LCAALLEDVPKEYRDVLEEHGGKYIPCPSTKPGAQGSQRFAWADILQALHREKLRSVMVEGGAQIINSLLHPSNHSLVDSVIVTIAPVWLGQGSVTVSPERVQDENGTALPVARLSNVSWHPFGGDVVLCGGLRG
jgi:2,5-diamino-6-(ribosylamino)-4(3H)-pyrimidinone 5'-phosphate reductase